MTTLSSYLHDLQTLHLTLHSRKEDLFWAAKMGLSGAAAQAQAELAAAEIELNRFLQDPSRLRRLRELAGSAGAAPSPLEQRILSGWIALFEAHAIDSEEGRALSEEIVDLEQRLQTQRATMQLGYTDPHTGRFERASSVKLALMARTDPDEARRRAAFEGLRSIETFVLEHGFLDIVRKRNQLGRLLGFEDFYDWRVAVVERTRKRTLFALLDDLLARTAERARHELDSFARAHGSSALEPYNFGYLRTGSLTRRLDPYFGFGPALRRWCASFAALGVRYQGATLTLDLLDRPGKYENGFMHGPGLGFIDGHTRRAARINFTSNAIVGQSGSGLRGLETLFHEGGHAAHFSNITAPASCFAHEFAPTSVAYAETQSMFMDSLIGDADWRVRYAKTLEGESMPWELIADSIREEQPFKGWNVRAMLTIPLAERALYELPDHQLDGEHVLAMFRRIEADSQGLVAGQRPVLAVPHLLAGESSAYYHGYVLAEMALHQIRAYFEGRDGYLTDNPRVGPELAQACWAPGNEVTFDDSIRRLVGSGLSADALVASCNRSVDAALAQAKPQVERALAVEPAAQPALDLDAHLRVVHGAELIADTTTQGYEGACAAFERWIAQLQAQAGEI
jgi:Peptidase family M3